MPRTKLQEGGLRRAEVAATNHRLHACVEPHLATTMADEMQINPQRAKQLAENLTSITSRINAANSSSRQARSCPSTPPETI